VYFSKWILSFTNIEAPTCPLPPDTNTYIHWIQFAFFDIYVGKQWKWHHEKHFHQSVVSYYVFWCVWGWSHLKWCQKLGWLIRQYDRFCLQRFSDTANYRHFDSSSPSSKFFLAPSLTRNRTFITFCAGGSSENGVGSIFPTHYKEYGLAVNTKNITQNTVLHLQNT